MCSDTCSRLLLRRAHHYMQLLLVWYVRRNAGFGAMIYTCVPQFGGRLLVDTHFFGEIYLGCRKFKACIYMCPTSRTAHSSHSPPQLGGGPTARLLVHLAPSWPNRYAHPLNYKKKGGGGGATASKTIISEPLVPPCTYYYIFMPPDNVQRIFQ